MNWLKHIKNTKARAEKKIKVIKCLAQRFRAETSRILKEKYKRHSKIYTDGSKKEEKVEYAVV
jgi:hypothetical protein